ncbi:AMP-binding enzyme [Embleya sp. AB8]|uniref:AMP-binding enzyme n=1 Tax=Embleya sp. AB8 TaxID=3156304 RepID=UPI003C744162
MLGTHPDVAECGVVGVADERRGMVVKAYVVLHPGGGAGEATARASQEFVKRTMAPYKYPRVVEFVGELPRTSTGRLRRGELRRWAAQGTPVAGARPVPG